MTRKSLIWIAIFIILCSFAYAENFMLNRPVACNSEVGGDICNNSRDGNIATLWQTAGPGEAQIWADLESNRTFNFINITHRIQAGEKHQPNHTILYGSDDNITFSVIFNDTSPNIDNSTPDYSYYDENVTTSSYRYISYWQNVPIDTNWIREIELSFESNPPVTVTTTYHEPVLENVQTDIYLNLDDMNTSEYNSTAILTYNGTEYTGTEIVINGTRKIFNVTVTTPLLSVDTNISFHFNYTINDTAYMSDTYNQEVDFRALDNCSTYTTNAINFTLYNDTTEISGTIEGFFDIAADEDFNITWGTGNDHSLCLHPNYANYTLDAQLEYNSDGNTEQIYYINDMNISNTTQLIDLYFISGTSQVTFTVVDQDDDAVEDVFIHIQKFDVATNTATTVEIIKTDTDGQAVGNIVKNTQLYKFILVRGGEIILETSERFILLDSHNFRVDLSSDYFDIYNVVYDVACDITYTNSTRTFSYTFADTNNTITQGCLRVVKRTINGDTVIEESCESAVSATINIVIPLPVSDNTYIGMGSVYVNNQEFSCGDAESVDFDESYKDWGVSGIFFTWLLSVGLVFIGIWSPVVSVVLMILAVVFMVIFGLFHLSWPVLVGFIIIGGITLYKMK